MNSVDKLRRFIPPLLRIPLGFIFLLFGIEKFFAPAATLTIIQASIFASLFPVGNVMIYVIGAVEVVVGAGLLLNVQIRKTAFLAAVLLLNIIIIAQIPQDIILLGVALALALMGNENPWKS